MGSAHSLPYQVRDKKMILEEETFEQYGYYPRDLKPHSNKPILAACDECGKVRETSKDHYHALCGSCAQKGKEFTEETKALLRAANKGENNPFFCKTHTEETRALISASKKGNKNRVGCILTEETKALISAAMKGKQNSLGYKHTEESRALMCKNQPNREGEKHPNWLGGISFEPYCIKFNNEYKDYIRNLFRNECFLCGKSEAENGRKLDVHHVNYNKDCGCDNTICICVPLCISCHVKTNFDRDYWQALISKKLKGTLAGW